MWTASLPQVARRVWLYCVGLTLNSCWLDLEHVLARPLTRMRTTPGCADASEEEVQLCQERTAELSALVNEFILRECTWPAVLLGGWLAGWCCGSRCEHSAPCRPAAGRTNTLLSQHLPPKVGGPGAHFCLNVCTDHTCSAWIAHACTMGMRCRPVTAGG